MEAQELKLNITPREFERIVNVRDSSVGLDLSLNESQWIHGIRSVFGDNITRCMMYRTTQVVVHWDKDVISEADRFA